MSWFPGWDSIAGAHWWENFYFWGSIVALILLGVMEIISHRYTERKDELTAIEEREIKRQHDEDMGRLHLQASQANERAEKLEKENLLIRERIAGRRISQAQHDAIVSVLSQFPATFDLNAMGEGEASLFASDIAKTLTDAGWTLKERQLPLNMSWNGLSISLSDDPDSLRLLTAFQAAGVAVNWFTEKRDIPTIWVGAKPSPF